MDSFLVRRARPILQGTVYKDFDFFFMPDFGGGGSGTAAPTIYDAWVNYTLIPQLQLEKPGNSRLRSAWNVFKPINTPNSTSAA